MTKNSPSAFIPFPDAAKPYVSTTLKQNGSVRLAVARFLINQSLVVYGATMGGLGALLWPSWGVYVAIAVYCLTFELAHFAGWIFATVVLATPTLSDAQWRAFRAECKPHQSFRGAQAQESDVGDQHDPFALRLYAAKALETPWIYKASWIVGAVLCAFVGAAVKAHAGGAA